MAYISELNVDYERHQYWWVTFEVSKLLLDEFAINSHTVYCDDQCRISYVEFSSSVDSIRFNILWGEILSKNVKK